MVPRHYSWVELDRAALRHNVEVFRRLAGADRALMVVVKANAYGHGMIPVARIALDAGADWLAVFSPEEAFALRDAAVAAPILVFGPTPDEALDRCAREGIDVTVADVSAVQRVVAHGAPAGCRLRVHVKLETGTQRQGLGQQELSCTRALADADSVELAGVYTHFADIEDTTDHSFANEQLRRFQDLVAALQAMGARPPIRHTACTAASLLFESTHFEMLRVGIGLYGLWPSKETLVSVRQSGREPVSLRPVMTWKTRISQVRDVPAGTTVGYGRTFKTTRPSRLAVLPVGYSDGYDRHLSSTAHVLVLGQRAKVCGRVMMNMTVVDVTDIPRASAGDEVVLLGAQGEEVITAEVMAAWLDTIVYEVVTRAEPTGPRIVV